MPAGSRLTWELAFREALREATPDWNFEELANVEAASGGHAAVSQPPWSLLT